MCLDAANSKSYPGSGTSWFDISGNGHVGSMLNGVTFNSSNMGIFNFDGTNDHIDMGNIYDNLTNFTISVWVRNTNSSQGGMLTKGLVNDSTEWGLSFGFSNPVLIVCRPRGTLQNLFASWVPYTVGWHNIVYTVNGSVNSFLYVDNELISSNTLSLSPGPTVGNLQVAKHGTQYHLGGSIAQVLLYNRAITSGEVAINFNAFRGRFGL